MSTAEESIPHGNQTAQAFMLTSALWFAIATTFGLIAASYLIAPDFMANIEYIQFGRMRPMHVNAVLFGFVTPGLIAVAFYYLPRLLKTTLYSEKLGVFSAVFWNFHSGRRHDRSLARTTARGASMRSCHGRRTSWW